MVYEAIAHEFNWKQKPIYKTARSGEIKRSTLSPTKAAHILGWRPSVIMREGLAMLHQSIL